jgi:hypothetical protein
MNPTTLILPVTQSMIDAEKVLDKIYNNSVVSIYNQAAKDYPDNAGRLKALGLPVPPPPEPPYLRFTDVNAIIFVEQQMTQGQQPPAFFTLVKYVPIVDVPTPTALTVSEAIPEFPGFFEVNGDGPSILVGASFDQNGHTYKKTAISYSPFAPGGVVTAWQQIL